MLKVKGLKKRLPRKVIENKNIQVYEQTLAVELLINSDSKCKGLIAFNDQTQNTKSFIHLLLSLPQVDWDTL